MVARRGEIWWAALPQPSGSGPGYERPVVIISSDSFNASQIRTVIIAALTSNVARASGPGNVLLKRKETRLPRDSVVNISQLLTIDKSLLVKRVSRLKPASLAELEAGLRLALGL